MKCQYGCNYSFVEDSHIEDFKCTSCNMVAKEPSLTTCCGEQYCKPFLQLIIDNGECCPSCNEKDFTFAPNKRAHRKIMALSVFCTMKQNGCDWEGDIKDLENHVKEDCKHVYIPCTNGCGQLQIKKGHLDNHLNNECPNREYSCPHCNYKGTYKFVTSVHAVECSYTPVKCPNKCGVEGERADMEMHIQEHCQLQYIQCTFHLTGCDEKFRRDNMNKHMEENLQKHLDSLPNMLLKMSEDIKSLEEKASIQLIEEEKKSRDLTELKDQLEKEKMKINVFMANNVTEELSPLEHQVDSEMGEHRVLKFKLEEKDREIQQLRQTLEEYKENLDHQKKLFEGRISKIEKSLCLRDLQDFSHKNVTQPNLPCDDDSRDVFTLENFSELKKAGKEWTSPPFKKNGFTLKLSVWPNGQREGRNTHVSVWLENGTEEVEYFVPAYFSVIVELVDQSHYCNNKQSAKTFTCDTIGIRYLGDFSNTFIAHSELENYLKNDSLKFKVVHIHVTHVQDIA